MTKLQSIDRLSILDMDASKLAEKIRNGELTSLEVVETYISQIERVNPYINAVVEKQYDQAIKQAKEYDKKAKEGHFLGPLHGVPISMKESLDVKGMKTTGGLIHRRDLIAKSDALAVTRMKEAGAIILVKTNTPTLCFCQETDNKLFGRTNNPWDLKRTAGGSSGGEGALLSAGGSAAGLGSDIGGSIRFPSHFNGVVGFKPSKNQVSQKGHFPHITHPLQERMQSIGPMGKSVNDIELLYTIIRTASHQPNKGLENSLVTFLPYLPDYPLSQTTYNMYTRIKNRLNHLSTDVGIPPHFKDSALLWQEIMSIDGGNTIRKEGFPSDRPNIVKEYLKEKASKTSSYHEYFTWALIGAALFKPTKRRQRDIKKRIADGDQEISTYFTNRVLILPVYHQGALHHGSVYNEIFSIRKTYQKYLPFVSYANVWGLSALTIPIAKDENNMPIGVQIVGTQENDSAVFELGKMLEGIFGGFSRCNKFDMRTL